MHDQGIDRKTTNVVDDEYVKPGDGLMPLSEYLEKYAENSIMIMGFGHYWEHKKKKEQYKDKIKYLYDFNLGIGRFEKSNWDFGKAQANRERYNVTYNMLADAKSKKTMAYFLEAAVTGTDEAVDKLYTEYFPQEQYYIDLVREQEIETLVDCGAFNGDTVHGFIRNFPDYKKIYAFEPDPTNRKKLEKRIQDENIRDITVIPKGVYKKTTTLCFTADKGGECCLDESGDIEIPVAALDEALPDCTDKLMIKMDIEGSEMDALKGAAKMITRHHPLLTICVYHRSDDLITIPQYIQSLVGEGVYDYYLRFHGTWLEELVLYAIPREEQ